MKDSPSDISKRYDPDTDPDRWLTVAITQAIVPLIRPGDLVLEFGCASGAMTEELVKAGAKVTAIDKTDSFLKRAEDRHLDHVKWVNADLDTWQSDGKYHHAIASKVLHLLADPSHVVEQAYLSLLPGGVFHVASANASSIHRIVGKAMGLLTDLSDIGETCDWIPTSKRWSSNEAVELIESCGFQLLFRTGRMVKPLPGALLDTLPIDVIEGFIKAGPALEEFAAVNHFLFGKVD